MQNKFWQHILSILLVGAVFLTIYFLYGIPDDKKSYAPDDLIKKYIDLNYLDLSSPEDRAILEESLNVFEPGQNEKHRILAENIAVYYAKRFESGITPRSANAPLSAEQAFELFFMLLKFAGVYILVLLLTYYGVETFGIYRFIRQESRANPPPPGPLMPDARWKEIRRWLVKRLRNLVKLIILLILFSPAYVIAYSFKTRFDTDSLLLMILLGTISNGLLITYTQKYFTFLQSEKRKGYVQTAIVKNLRQGFNFNAPDGIPLKAIFRLRKKFPGHILDHLYENVRFQYLNTLKEQASFLITGLIIIEMALNIQGHLCYTLMQNILYKNLPVVLMIVFGIFVTVKLTEIFIDSTVTRQLRHLDNLPGGGSDETD